MAERWPWLQGHAQARDGIKPAEPSIHRPPIEDLARELRVVHGTRHRQGTHQGGQGSAAARTVRVQVITPPAALNREGQRQLVKEVTEIIARVSGDPSQAGRTWVLLTEAAEGGWGLAGTAFGREEFAALAAKAKAAANPVS